MAKCAVVATDIAARGLDIDNYHVVFDCPMSWRITHRIGRTGRAGALGQAVSLVSNEETAAQDIERLINRVLERQRLKASALCMRSRIDLNAQVKEQNQSRGEPTCIAAQVNPRQESVQAAMVVKRQTATALRSKELKSKPRPAQ